MDLLIIKGGAIIQTHNPTYCCSVMETWIQNNVIAVDPVGGKAYMNVHYTPTPGDTADPEPTIIRIEVKQCPNCGDKVGVYSENYPAPTYTRASALGEACDDSTCKFHNNESSICSFQYINEIGCYATNSAAKQAISDLLVNVQIGYLEMTKQ